MSAAPTAGSKPASALADYLKNPKIQKALVGAGIGGLGLSSLSALSGNTAANSALYGLLGAGLGGGIGANSDEIKKTFEDVTSAGDDNPLANLPSKGIKGVLAGGAGAIPAGLGANKLYNLVQKHQLDSLTKELVQGTRSLKPDSLHAKHLADVAKEKMKGVAASPLKRTTLAAAMAPALIAAGLGNNDAALTIGAAGTVGAGALAAGDYGVNLARREYANRLNDWALNRSYNPPAASSSYLGRMGNIIGDAVMKHGLRVKPPRQYSRGSAVAALGAVLASLAAAYNETR